MEPVLVVDVEDRDCLSHLKEGWLHGELQKWRGQWASCTFLTNTLNIFSVAREESQQPFTQPTASFPQ